MIGRVYCFAGVSLHECAAAGFFRKEVQESRQDIYRRCAQCLHGIEGDGLLRDEHGEQHELPRKVTTPMQAHSAMVTRMPALSVLHARRGGASAPRAMAAASGKRISRSRKSSAAPVIPVITTRKRAQGSRRRSRPEIVPRSFFILTPETAPDAQGIRGRNMQKKDIRLCRSAKNGEPASRRWVRRAGVSAFPSATDLA